MNANTIDDMTADELSRYMIEKTSKGEIPRGGPEYMALYDVFCAKKKAENENRVFSLSCE